MNEVGINAAEGAVYTLSAVGLALCIVAAFFVRASLQDRTKPDAQSHPAAE